MANLEILRILRADLAKQQPPSAKTERCPNTVKTGVAPQPTPPVTTHPLKHNTLKDPPTPPIHCIYPVLHNPPAIRIAIRTSLHRLTDQLSPKDQSCGLSPHRSALDALRSCRRHPPQRYRLTINRLTAPPTNHTLCCSLAPITHSASQQQQQQDSPYQHLNFPLILITTSAAATSHTNIPLSIHSTTFYLTAPVGTYN
ncbi:hypothetical protein PCANC_21668 [Puccinia coronata f. sp. avenae]|nr:hypothetical protein PCANC_21668 [Puccinia coronata f. sp. avenae]